MSTQEGSFQGDDEDDHSSTIWFDELSFHEEADEQSADVSQNVYLTITNVPPEEWSFHIDDRRQSIGRSSESGICIPQRFSYVSRQHAEIWREKSKFYLCDVGSKAGTRVNGIWLKQNSPTSILVGDYIWLGGVDLELVQKISPMAELMVVLGAQRLNQVAQHEANPMHTKMLPVRTLLSSLTPTELEIAIWLCRGYFDDTALGKLLHRSPNTIRTQVGSIMRKLNLRSRHDIIGLLKRN